jgi:hypothetical protein
VPKDRDLDRIERPDIEIGARVKAKRLRFRKKPETDVRPYAEPEGETTSGSERKNLPDEVEARVTYRDVEVRWRAAARIAAPDQRRR